MSGYVWGLGVEGKCMFGIKAIKPHVVNMHITAGYVFNNLLMEMWSSRKICKILLSDTHTHIIKSI